MWIVERGKWLKFAAGPARLKCRGGGVAAVACFEAAHELRLLLQTASARLQAI